jgi:hypothetical protein
VGIAAGAGLAGAAVANRRRRPHPSEVTNSSPGETSAPDTEDAPAAARPDHANDPTGAAERGDPKGPGFADAA